MEPQPRSVSPAGRLLGTVLARLSGFCGCVLSSATRFRFREAFAGLAAAAAVCTDAAACGEASPDVCAAHSSVKDILVLVKPERGAELLEERVVTFQRHRQQLSICERARDTQNYPSPCLPSCTCESHCAY